MTDTAHVRPRSHSARRHVYQRWRAVLVGEVGRQMNATAAITRPMQAKTKPPGGEPGGTFLEWLQI